MRGGLAKFNGRKLSDQLSSEEMLRKHTVEGIRKNGWQQRVKAIALDYSTWCNNNCWISFPVSAESLEAYLCHYVARNKGSTRSIGNVKSALKNYSLKNDIQWLNEADQYHMKLFIKQLEFNDTTPIKRAKPATMDIIIKVSKVLNRNSVQDFHFLMSMLLAHNGLLRGKELCSGILASDLVWHRKNKYFILSLSRSKTHRKGGPQDIHISDYPGLSAYKLIVEWMNKFNLWDKPNYYLLPSVNGKTGKLNFLRPEGLEKFRYRVKKYFSQANAGSGFTGHSFRAGSATDLFANGVPVHEVQKMGRWKSLAVLVYYREEAVEVARKAAKAFASICRFYRKGSC